MLADIERGEGREVKCNHKACFQHLQTANKFPLLFSPSVARLRGRGRRSPRGIRACRPGSAPGPPDRKQPLPRRTTPSPPRNRLATPLREGGKQHTFEGLGLGAFPKAVVRVCGVYRLPTVCRPHTLCKPNRCVALRTRANPFASYRSSTKIHSIRTSNTSTSARSGRVGLLLLLESVEEQHGQPPDHSASGLQGLMAVTPATGTLHHMSCTPPCIPRVVDFVKRSSTERLAIVRALHLKIKNQQTQSDLVACRSFSRFSLFFCLGGGASYGSWPTSVS